MSDHSPVHKFGQYEIWQWIGWAVAAVVALAIIAVISHGGTRRSLRRSLGVVMAIARVTAAEMLRKKVLYVILMFAVGCILAMNLFTHFEPGGQETMKKDLGLELITLFAGLIVVITAMSLIPEEIERRTIHPMLAKPVRRSEFVVGKFVGAIAPLAISMGIMLIVLMAMLVVDIEKWWPLAVNFGPWPWEIVLAITLMFFAMVVLAAIVILASTRVSTILAALVGVVTFALGVNMGYLYNLARPEHVAGNPVNAITFGVLASVLPNFSMFDLRVYVATPPVVWPQLWALFGNGVLYAVGYLAAVLVAAALLFNEREV